MHLTKKILPTIFLIKFYYQLINSVTLISNGPSAGDTTLGNGDDNTYSISLGFEFSYFNYTYTSIYISINGFLMFGTNPSTRFFNYTGKRNQITGPFLIAPYLYDFNTFCFLCTSNGFIYYRHITDAATLNTIGSEISSAKSTAFTPNHAFVFTWSSVKAYITAMGVATFQVIFSTDGSTSYMTAYYNSCPVNDGFVDNAGLPYSAFEYYNTSNILVRNIYSNPCYTSNINQTGKWIFKLSYDVTTTSTSTTSTSTFTSTSTTSTTTTSPTISSFTFDFNNLNLLISLLQLDNQDLNGCLLNCSSKGQCLQDQVDFKYKCLCDSYFTGSFCNIDVRPCFSNPCLNNGTCANTFNLDNNKLDFVCQCSDLFSGTYCETAKDVCQNETCSNNGVCSNSNNWPKCKCHQYYSGEKCEKEAEAFKTIKTVNKVSVITAIVIIISFYLIILFSDFFNIFICRKKKKQKKRERLD